MRPNSSYLRILAGLILLVVLAGGQRAYSAIGLVTSPAALFPDDAIDWGQLGPNDTAVPSPAAVLSLGGRAATASTTDPGGLHRNDQGPADPFWKGNFSPGDRLLTNANFEHHPLTIEFAVPVAGAGANIQLDAYEPFTASLEAFNGATSLGLFTVDGVSNDANDGSAVFIGVLDTSPQITRIVFGLINPPLPPFAPDFAINSLRLNTTGIVPEPSALVLLGLGTIGLLGAGWRRRKRAYTGQKANG